jgi:putative addiction module component (TIGR02574 family)
MSETTVPSPPGFSELSKSEQIRYLQALWDQIAENPASLPAPESHLKLVEERLRHYRDVPSSAHSAFEVLDRLSNKPK